MRAVILGSTLRYRRELIERLGITVTCIPSPFDEEAAKEGLCALPVAEQAQALAIGKAEALGEQDPDAVIVGADPMSEVDGEALGARSQLRRLAGRKHRLHTNALVIRSLTEKAIADYVARDAPLNCAGSYRVAEASPRFSSRSVGVCTSPLPRCRAP